MIRTIHSLRALALLAVVTVMAGAQAGRRPPTPPEPPTPPTPPTPPAAPRPIAAPRIRLDNLHLDLDLALREAERSIRHIDTDEMRRITSEATRHAMEASREAMALSREVSREALERSRETTREAVQQATEQTRAALERSRLDFNGFNGFNGFSGFNTSVNSRFGPYDQSDPADSLYKQAASLFNSSDFRAAAQRFKELQTRYPNSQYISRSMYYQSLALYRAGSDAELREALSVIEARQQRFPNASMEDPSYPTRIRRMLAERGDASARTALQQTASSGQETCDREQQSVRAEALSGLQRVDPAAAQVALERVLARRDECSINLRRSALQILTRQGDEKSIAVLVSTAKNDPSPRMRADALEYVSRFPSDEVFALLETAARTESNETIRHAAARNLVGYPSARARQATRSLIEDNTIPDNVRMEMLGRYNNSDRGTTEDATWLRAAFPRVTSPSVRRSIVAAVGRIGGADSQRWLMDMAANDQESVQLRTEAFRTVSSGMSTPDLISTYDKTAVRSLRVSIARALNSRKEPEALDKLILIVRRSTDDDERRTVLNMLTERKDPKVTALLLELIDK